MLNYQRVSFSEYDASLTPILAPKQPGFCQPLRLQRSCPCAPVWIFVSFQRKTRTCPTCPKFSQRGPLSGAGSQNLPKPWGFSNNKEWFKPPLKHLAFSIVPFPLKKSPNIPQPCFPCLTVIFVSFVPSHIILKNGPDSAIPVLLGIQSVWSNLWILHMWPSEVGANLNVED